MHSSDKFPYIRPDWDKEEHGCGPVWAISNLTIVQGKINGYTIESDELNDEFVHGTVLVWVEPEPILIDLMEARLMEDDSLLEGDLSPEILVLIDEQVRQFE